MTAEPEVTPSTEVGSDPIKAPDVILVLLTLPLFLFAVMFMTSSGTTILGRAGARRKLALMLLVVEVAVVFAIVQLA